MTTYKLIDGIHDSQQIQVVRRKGGIVRYEYARLFPGVVYQAENDDLFLNSLHNAKVTRRHSDELEKELKAQGIKYSVEKTRCCGGGRKVLTYEIVEVVNSDEA